MVFSIERIVQAVALYFAMARREFCARLPAGSKAKEAQVVLGRLLYRHAEGAAGDWEAVGRVTRALDPKACIYGAEPAAYRAIFEELERQPELLPEEAPAEPPPKPPPAPVRIPEGVSGRPLRGRGGRVKARPAKRVEPVRVVKTASPVPVWRHFLESDLVGAVPMAERVVLAAGRAEQALVEGMSLSIYRLRPGKQRAIFEDAARFLRAIADGDAWFEKHGRAGRIGAPPRTGKTVIAGQIIAASGMVTTFVVPTKTLVRQAESDLRTQLPGVPVGVFFSEEKRLVEYGVNIVTYSMLARYFEERGHLPTEIAASSLVICDEGHRSMSKMRQRVLRDGFEKDAVRIAMTGSENFNERRQLRFHFPWLIHKITIEEAVELEMFAETRVYVAEVDVSASTVQIVAGDLDQSGLGKIMSAVPFFEGARVYRYHGENRGKQALICCIGRQQALDLQQYLKEHRPPGTPEPVVVLEDTRNRQAILDAFAAGKIDTLINVGVLIEGWNAPRCKVLIDLAPTCSLVRATQKYFRPMTAWEDHEAAIYVLLPKELRAVPVLPMDLFGYDRREYEQGELIAPKARREQDQKEPEKRPQMPSIAKVTLASRFLFQGLFTPPELDPEDDKQILEVLLSSPKVTEERVPGFAAFLRMQFGHPLFQGLGQTLLRFLGISVSRKQGKWEYLEFIARYLPEAAFHLWTDRNYCGGTVQDGGDSCEPDRQHLLRELHIPESWSQGEAFADCWRHVACGAELLQGEEGEHRFDERLLWEALDRVLDQLDARQRRVLELRFALFGEGEERTFVEIGEMYGLSHQTIRQTEARALWRLANQGLADPLRAFWKDGI